MRNKKFLAIAFAFALAIGIGTAEAGDKSKGPITLETMGVFWVGGQIVDRTDPALAGHKILSGATYVEYFIPQNKTTVPVIIAHRVIPGVIFQATTDGREGWAQYFVRQGFPVYIFDSLGTGRAGFEVDQINLAATCRIPPLTSDPLDPTTDSDTWVRFRMGPEFGVLGDGISLGNQMATDPEALKRFLGVVGLPRRVPFPSNDVTAARSTELLQKTGPAIWIGWSSAGGNGLLVAVAHPELFRAWLGVEGCAGVVVTPALVNALVAHNVPVLNINGGTADRTLCKPLVDAVTAAGGDATLINLPDIGISGNGHMMFFEKNSDDIAKVVVDWIQKHVKK